MITNRRKQPQEDNAIQQIFVPSETVFSEFDQKKITPRQLWERRAQLAQMDGSTEPSVLLRRALLAVLEGDSRKALEELSTLPEDDPDRIAVELVVPGISIERLGELIRRMQVIRAQTDTDLTVTIFRPSILNDFRDFTPDWDRLMENQMQTETLFHLLYGEQGGNAFQLARAENLYQKGEPLQALLLVAGLIPLLEKKKDIQMLFTALSIQFRIMTTSGQVLSLQPLMDNLRQKVHAAGKDEWLSSIAAMEAWVGLYNGDGRRAVRWLRTDAPDEYSEFCMLDLYGYMVKLRIYLMQEKEIPFVYLSQRLLTVVRQNNRRRDTCELLLLCAMEADARQAPEDADRYLTEALAMAEQYRYDRLVADEGERMLRLLLQHRKLHGKNQFLDHMIVLSRQIAALYPRYLRQLPEETALSRTELVVLRFLADGRKNAEIAQLMDVKLDTVKAHCKHINQKLRADNRQQAVCRAKELGILD